MTCASYVLREIHVLLFLSFKDFWAHDAIYQSMWVLTQVTLLDPLNTVDGGAPVWVKVVQFDLIGALKECEGDWRVPFEKWMLQNCPDSCLNMQHSHVSVTPASGIFTLLRGTVVPLLYGGKRFVVMSNNSEIIIS